MKTTIKKYLVVVMMLGTFLNYANGTETSMNTIDGKKVRVEFKTVKKGHTLSIKDDYGAVMYRQEIAISGNYSKIFDLSLLEKGNYTTELEKDYEIIIKSFTVLEGNISFNEEKIIFKPAVRVQNNLILISKISFDKDTSNITLYYNNEVIFSETISQDEPILNRIYKISEEQKGDYKVIINNNNRSYSKDFKI